MLGLLFIVLLALPALSLADEPFYTTQSFCWPPANEFEISPRFRYNLKDAESAEVAKQSLKKSYGIQSQGNEQSGVFKESCKLGPYHFQTHTEYSTIEHRYQRADCTQPTTGNLTLYEHAAKLFTIPFGHGCEDDPEVDSMTISAYQGSKPQFNSYNVNICLKSPAASSETIIRCKSYPSYQLQNSALTADQLARDIPFPRPPSH